MVIFRRSTINKMTEHQVTCITKPHRESAHEHITHIGNLEQHWRLTREAAINRIDSKAEQFFTVDRQSGNRSYVGVVREAGKAPYLKTHADGVWNNNLLAQAECDGSCGVIQ